MNKLNDDITPDEAVFLTAERRTLADVLESCEAELEGVERRDMRSAFRFLTSRCGLDLASTLARPRDLRAVFADLHHVTLGVSEKRLANVKSLLTSAVRRFGMPTVPITKSIPPAPDWRALLSRIPDNLQKSALSRLACYCSVKRIAPDKVDGRALLGLHRALDAECATKNPRNIVKRTIAVWNMCLKNVEDWPGTKLSSPFKTEPYMLPLEAFPEGFQRDVMAFEERMRNPDPLDSAAPVRALRPDTIKGYRYTFRRAASALVREGVAQLDDITGFAALFEGDRFKASLRPYLPKVTGGGSGYVHRMATQLIIVARALPDLDPERLEEMKAVARRLAPQAVGGMGERNRQRLARFDDEAAIRTLLSFPAEEQARALVQKDPKRRAKCVERALSVSLLLFTGIRVKNLRHLRLDESFRKAGARVFLKVAASEAKTHADIELELPEEVARLMDEFARNHRPALPGAESAWLFPGPTGGARSYSGMRDATGVTIYKRTGLRLSPHLYRHIIAKIVAERCPENLHHVSRMLGHKSMRTTYQSYLGTEGPAASRRVASVLRGAADGAGGRKQ